MKRRNYGSDLDVCFGRGSGRNSGTVFRSFSTMQGLLLRRRQRPPMRYWQWNESTLPSRSTTVYSPAPGKGGYLVETEQRERIVCGGPVRLQRYQAKANPEPKPETTPPMKAGLRIEASMRSIIAQEDG